MPNPVLGTSQKEPALGAGFTYLGPYRGHVRATKKKFLAMQYRKAEIYPSSLDLSVQKWYVKYSYMHPFTGKFERFKVYEDINRHKGHEKIEYAKNLRDAVNTALQGGYNPFDESEKMEMWIQENERWMSAEASGDLSQCTMIRGLALFIVAKKEKGLSSSSISAYTTTANFIRNWLNEDGMLLVPARNITGRHLLDLLKREAEKSGWENKTYNNYLLFTETILNWMAERINGAIIPFNPLEGAERRQVFTRKHTPYSDDQLAAVLNDVRAKKDAFMEGIILTCYYACVRSKAELREFRIDNIQFDRDLLRLDAEGTKASEDQFIPLDPKLKEYYLSKGFDKLPKDWYVFGNQREPGPVQAAENFYARLFLEYKRNEALGLSEDHTLYAFKHTRGIHLAKAKVDPYAIMQLFRHKSLDQTMIYLRDLGCTINRDAVENSRVI